MEQDVTIPQLEINTTVTPETEPSNYSLMIKAHNVNMSGLNPDFVNMDVEMATPSGIIVQ